MNVYVQYPFTGAYLLAKVADVAGVPDVQEELVLAPAANRHLEGAPIFGQAT